MVWLTEQLYLTFVKKVNKPIFSKLPNTDFKYKNMF